MKKKRKVLFGGGKGIHGRKKRNSHGQQQGQILREKSVKFIKRAKLLHVLQDHEKGGKRDIQGGIAATNKRWGRKWKRA